MPPLKVYKIYNYVDENDDEFYIGSTKQKHLCNRWGNHVSCCKKGLNRKLYNHMREKGIENFKCIQIHSEEINDKDVDAQKAIEQKYIDELKPTLNLNNAKGWCDVAVDKARTMKTIDELRRYNSDAEKKIVEYGKEYHKTYGSEYYLKNKERIKAKDKQYSELNKDRLLKEKKIKNEQIKLTKEHYCENCDLAFPSPSHLNKHNLSKRHLKTVEKA